MIESGATEEKPKFNTDAERYLIKLNSSLPKNDEGSGRLKKLCDVNIQKSADSWLKYSEMMKDRVSSKHVSMKGLIFDRKAQNFNEIDVL